MGYERCIHQKETTMLEFFAGLAGLIFSVFGPSIILMVLTSIPRSKED